MGRGVESFGNARLELEHVEPDGFCSPPPRKIAPPLVSDNLPRYMQPTESSASAWGCVGGGEVGVVWL